MVTVTRKFEFAYAHCLSEHQGKCKNLHGHNAILEIEVAQHMPGIMTAFDKQQSQLHSIPLKESMVVDFGDLSELVKTNIIERLDHKYLNELFPFHPTAENLCIWIANTLQQTTKNIIMRVRVWETSNCYAEWRKGNSI